MSDATTWITREDESPEAEFQEDRGRRGVSWTHRLAALVAVFAFFLIVLWTLAAALTTFRTTPRWTTIHEFAHPFRFASYAADYRRLAVIVGCLALGIALRLAWGEWPRYVRWFSWIPVALLGVLTGVDSTRILSGAAIERSVFTDISLQVFFVLAVCLALFTRSDWRCYTSKLPDVRTPSFRSVSVVTTGLIIADVVLGAFYGDRALRQAPHIFLGFFVVAGALWLLELGFVEIPALPVLKFGTVLLAEMIAIQVFLGIVTVSIRLDNHGLASPGFVVMAATHAGTGALTLATSLYVTFQAFRHLKNG